MKMAGTEVSGWAQHAPMRSLTYNRTALSCLVARSLAAAENPGQFQQFIRQQGSWRPSDSGDRVSHVIRGHSRNRNGGLISAGRQCTGEPRQ